MKLLIQLPNSASTSKYPKSFPQPLNLSCLYSDGDILFDMALECYKQKKDEIFGIIDSYINKINNISGATEIIVNAGDYAPDAAYSEYFEYFLDNNKNNIKLIGSYAEIYKDKIEDKYKNVKCEKHDYRFPNYFAINHGIYPLVGGKIKASIRATYGCPRECAMCPVPIIHNKKYEFYDIGSIVLNISKLYNLGVRYITFIDDNLAVSPKFKRLLEEIKKLNLKGVKFHCQEGFEVSSIDKELCLLLKETKFDDIKIAFENIKPEFLKLIKKSYITPEVIYNSAEILRETKLDAKSFFLMGLDETEEDIFDNLKFFAEYGLKLRVNIIRDYNNDFSKQSEKKISEARFKQLKAFAYSVGFFNEMGINIFKGKEDLKKKGYILTDETIEGKTKFGFQTCRFETGVEFIYNKKIKENNGKSIRF